MESSIRIGLGVPCLKMMKMEKTDFLPYYYEDYYFHLTAVRKLKAVHKLRKTKSICYYTLTWYYIQIFPCGIYEQPQKTIFLDVFFYLQPFLGNALTLYTGYSILRIN